MSADARSWIYSRSFDLLFILAPAFVITAAVICVPGIFRTAGDLPLWAWVVFVMLIDVAHVYSTLFRTYFDSEEVDRRGTLFTIIPVLCWLVGVLLYWVGAAVFWSVLAYLAVYHFVRQQYGFMMIYARKEGAAGWRLNLDRWAIYLATVYPLIFWHTHLPRNFEWFIAGDFIPFSAVFVERLCWFLYCAVLTAYVLKELAGWRAGQTLSLGKNLLLIGTVLSWYVGIVHYNGDMAFTLTNVVSHGIPYIALVWIYEHKKLRSAGQVLPRIVALFRPKYIPIYVLLLALLAYGEELLWDTFVWREHAAVFGSWFGISAVTDGLTLTWLVPLLAMPQATHYVLDAFIWRLRKPDPGLSFLVRE